MGDQRRNAGLFLPLRPAAASFLSFFSSFPSSSSSSSRPPDFDGDCVLCLCLVGGCGRCRAPDERGFASSNQRAARQPRRDKVIRRQESRWMTRQQRKRFDWASRRSICNQPSLDRPKGVFFASACKWSPTRGGPSFVYGPFDPDERFGAGRAVSIAD